MLRLKKKDKVIVLSGKDKGKKGEIKEVIADKDRVIVNGINIVSKHSKPKKNKTGGIVKIEAAIHISKVQLVCSKCDKPARIKVQKLDSGDKVRICRKCGEVII